MPKTYRYNRFCPMNDPELTETKIAFVRAYTESWNSLEAYKATHEINSTNKNSIKVTATTILQNPAIWTEAIKAIREKENKTRYDKHILMNCDKAIHETGMDPVTIYETYSEMIDTEECPENETINTDENIEVSEEDANPLSVIKKLAYAYSFFNIVNRQYFMNAIRDAIKREMDYVDHLAKHNKIWYNEYRMLNNLLIREIGVNLNLIIEG